MTTPHVRDPVSAADVSAEIRLRLPDVTDRYMHWLLYFAQGHHLAMFGVPLFREPIVAGPSGPVVVFETTEDPVDDVQADRPRTTEV